MRRSLLFSCALHGVIVLIALATTPRRAAHESVGAAEIALEAAPMQPMPAVAIDVDVLAHAGGGGPTRPTEPAVVASARPHRRSPVATRAIPAETPPAPGPTPAIAAPLATDDGVVEVAQAAPASGPSGAPGDQAAGAGDGASAGDGLGDGVGDGFGPGAGGTAMSRELHARVLGNEEVDVRPRADAPTISHDEATALRTRDRFPRLPESVWSDWRPYLVKLELCVGADGRVHEAVLRSSASPRLDPVVLAAAKTWQYRPRLVDGKPAPFCHGVVIKYERW
jgi:outer membrane biosynthesis protein TonB